MQNLNDSRRQSCFQKLLVGLQSGGNCAVAEQGCQRSAQSTARVTHAQKDK
jgi:hypothetical protein